MPEQRDPEVGNPPVADKFEYGETDFRPGIDSVEELPPPKSKLPPKDEKGRFTKPVSEEAPGPSGPDESVARPTHPAVLLRRAEAMGFTRREMDAMSTEDLDSAVYEQTQTELRQLRASRRQEDAERREPTPMDNFRADAHPVKGKNDHGINPEVWEDLDPTLQSLFDGMKKRLDTVEGAARNLSEREEVRARETAAQRNDRMFTSVNMPQIFGQGGIQDLQDRRDGKSIERRNAILRLAGSGDPKASPEARFHAAIELLYPATAAPTRAAYEDEVQQEDEQPVGRPTLRQWHDAALTRPDNRTSHDELPPGPEKAARTVARHQRQNGIATLVGDTTLDEFPDRSKRAN